MPEPKLDHFCSNTVCLLHPEMVPDDDLDMDVSLYRDTENDNKMERALLVPAGYEGQGFWHCKACYNVIQWMVGRGEHPREYEKFPGWDDRIQRAFCANPLCVLHPERVSNKAMAVDVLRPNGLVIPVPRKVVLFKLYRSNYFVCDGCANAVDRMIWRGHEANPQLGLQVNFAPPGDGHNNNERHN